MEKLLCTFLAICLLSVTPLKTVNYIDNTNAINSYINTTTSVANIQDLVWSGNTATSFAGGNGTAQNPYLIATGEQLALALTSSYCSKSFKLTADIYLNNIYIENWQSQTNCNQWIDNHTATKAFTGTFDGDGYVVYGMYFNYEITPKNTYVGLFPNIGGSAAIKNVGVSHAYIKAAIGDESVYAGGLFGMGSAFYDFYGKKIGPSETVNDEFLIPGDTTPTKLPSFTNCFVDHTCYIEANAVGGIGCPGGAVIVIRDCYVTATLKGKNDTYTGALIGNQWSKGSRLYNSLALPQNDIKPSVGTHQWVRSESQICYYHENVYYYGTNNIYGVTSITRPQWRVGEDAKAAMPNLDWQNTWRTQANGTPVLRVFDKEGRSGSIFSDKTFNIPTSQISFETGDSAVVVEPIVGKAYEPVTLPTPAREGYIFTGWHAYSDLTLEYPYDYFLLRDITLYASWKEISVVQDFEDYPYTEWDCDSDCWRYNRYVSIADIFKYKKEYVHSGAKSMQYTPNSDKEASLLLNYEKTLTAGQEYTISLWVATDVSDFSQLEMALVHKTYPDYLEADVAVEDIATITGLKKGNWTKYTYTFTACSPWVALKIMGDQSIYIDDINIISSKNAITELVVPDGAKKVNTAEYFKSNFTTAKLSKGVTKIGDYAFTYSKQLKNILITNSVESIEEYAFYGCNKLTDVWYTGTKEQAESIIISANNQALYNAVWHYNSCDIGTQHVYDDDNDLICNICGTGRITPAWGDISGDGKINNKDLGLLMQYLNGWDVEIIDTVADVNNDGKINNKDYGLLMQFINGWELEINFV